MTFTFLKPSRHAKIGPDALLAEGEGTAFVRVDASVSEDHEARWELTSHPVPEGLSVTDHKRPTPRVLKMDCVISNKPLSGGIKELSDLTSADELFETVSGAVQGTLAVSERDTNAWEQLKRYADSAELLDVYTTLESYTNMQITSLSTTRTAQTGDSLHFTVVLQEIRIADEQTAEALQLRTGRPEITKQAQKGKTRKQTPAELVKTGTKIGIPS